MAAREATPPPVIGKAGPYTIFITPPPTPRPLEGSRLQTTSPSSSPKLGPRNAAPLLSESFRSRSSSPREKMRSSLSPKGRDSSPVKGFEKAAAVAAPPPVQVPPPQFEKGKGGRSAGGAFGFFWDAVAKVQDAHSNVDQYLADWLGLDQSRYQWALNDYYESNGSVAGVPGVTEALFQARQSALAEERSKLSATPMLYSCAICGKEYRSAKAHAQHLNSRTHVMRASQESGAPAAGIAIIKPLTGRAPSKSTSFRKAHDEDETEESDDEWVEVDPDDNVDMASESLDHLHVDEHASVSGADKNDDMDEDEKIDTSCCFVCDLKHDTIENCMIHMHKQHGFFIPDVEYLKDPEGFLTYVGLKVMRDFLCLYCNDRCHPFQSLEAVRKHMIAKGHCKIRYGDGGDDEEAEFEEFYDYSSSYVDEDGKQLVASSDLTNNVELGSGGAELIITQKTDSRTTVRTLGSREFLRYYRQKPRPSPASNIALAASLASRYRSMGLATVQSREQMVRMKVVREMNRRGVEAMRSKIGMRSNVIRNLPKNVPY